MKRAVSILLLLNLLVFIYLQYSVPTTVSSSLQPELHPEQMKLLQPADLQTYPARAPAQTAYDNPAVTAEAVAPAAPTLMEPAVPAAVACYEWGSFNQNKARKAAAIVQKLGVKAVVNQHTAANENTRYWIYRPPLESLQAAQAKAEALRQLGVPDVFVVQEAKWRNAISFGVFRDEHLADKLLEDLKSKGVTGVIKTTRFGGEGQTILKLQAVSAEAYTQLKRFQPQFPDAVLKQAACQP